MNEHKTNTGNPEEPVRIQKSQPGSNSMNHFAKTAPVRKKTIGIIGPSVMDLMVQGCPSSILDVQSTPVKAIQISSGGDAFNESFLLARLKADVTLHTLLGDDQAGAFLKDCAVQAGVHLSLPEWSVPTPVNVVLCDETGERHFLTDPNTALRKLSLKDLSDLDEEIIMLASMFVSHELSIADAASLFSRLKQEGKITCMDMTSPKKHETVSDLAPLLPYVDYLFCNRDEGSALCHTVELEAILNAFFQNGARTVLLKDGAAGVHVLHQGTIRTIPAVPCPKVVSTNGCGDAFGAGFLFGLANGLDFEQSVHIAATCGSLAATCLGASSAFTEEVCHQIQNMVIADH